MKKIFTAGLITVLLIFGMVELSLASAYSDYMDSVTLAAEGMMAAQNNDGSFDWVNDGDPTDSGAVNTQGATARGLVAAYNQTGNTEFLDAANKTAGWIAANIPTTMYNKDVEFLYELAAAGGTDYTALAATSAINYFNDKITQTGAVDGANAVYARYKDAAWVASSGTLDGLKYWMIGEWGDVGRLLGDTEIYSGYTGNDLAQGIGTLLSDDFTYYNNNYATIDPYESYSTLGFVGILEGMWAGIESGDSYTNTASVIDTLADRVDTFTGVGGWQSLGYATYALNLFDDPSALNGRDILTGWINDGYYDTSAGAYLESNGEALLGLASSPAPVPEPATLLLFGIGIVGLLGTKVRRKKKI